jgi:hypothetical protein
MFSSENNMDPGKMTNELKKPVYCWTTINS